MGSMGKKLYEVRVREKVGPSRYMKKNKFYNASSPGEARALYKGEGHIMWVEKVSREKLMGVGEFFSMGDRLMKEFARERSGGGDGSGTLLEQIRSDEKEKARQRRLSFLKHRREEGS